MRIRSDETICGLPALTLRKLLRRWTNNTLGAPIVARDLAVSKKKAKEIFDRILAEELVESELHPDYYRLTTKGAALAQASAAKPIRRETARKRLRELVERMARANEDDRLYVGVERAVVFGSYLTDVPDLGDLDISYTTFRKIEDSAVYMSVTNDAARASGRSFGNYVEFVCWPDHELRRFLKNRSRVYSLHVDEGILDDPSIPRLTIFENRRPVENWEGL